MIKDQPFKTMKQLVALDLAHNNLPNLSDKELLGFKGLINLLELDLTNNKISTVSSNFFQHLPKLEVLRLYGNNLKIFGPFQQKIPLILLHLGENLLFKFPMLNAPYLKVLDMTNIFLQTVRAVDVKWLPNLKVLSLMSNRLFAIDFSDTYLPDLQLLSLQKITSLTVLIFPIKNGRR